MSLGLLLALASLIDRFQLLERCLDGRRRSLLSLHMRPQVGRVVQITLYDEDVFARTHTRGALAEDDMVDALQAAFFRQHQ